MWRRKAEVVISLLQGLTVSQIGTRSGTLLPSGRQMLILADVCILTCNSYWPIFRTWIRRQRPGTGIVVCFLMLLLLHVGPYALV